MGQHALLSPSAAHRWLNCPPSARLCEGTDDTGSVYAQTGTEAHELCEYKLRKYLGEKATDPRPNLTYFDQSMDDNTDEYALFCIGEYERLKAKGDTLMIIEQRVRYEEYVPQGSGSADCLIIGNGEMVVIDYKNGALLVEAENNPQLYLYGVGCLLGFDGIYDIDTVKMCIIQPNRENIDSVTLPKDTLYQWAETVVKPAAQLAWKGEGEQHAGTHCQFCRIKATCRERARANLELARFDFKDPATLDNDEISDVLEQADELTRWVSDVKEYALAAALKGEKFPRFKLVSGRSNREYTDETAIADRLRSAGYYDIFKAPKLLGLTEMTKLLGKSTFGILLEGAEVGEDGKPAYPPLIAKPAGKPVLVPESDKRTPIKVNTAAEDFADHENL